jgi:hypothetical protein
MANNEFAKLAAEYKSLWDNAVIREQHRQEVTKTARKVRDLKSTYDKVSAATNVPWYIVLNPASKPPTCTTGTLSPRARYRNRPAVRRKARRLFRGRRAPLMP